MLWLSAAVASNYSSTINVIGLNFEVVHLRFLFRGWRNGDDKLKLWKKFMTQYVYQKANSRDCYNDPVKRDDILRQLDLFVT